MHAQCLPAHTHTSPAGNTSFVHYNVHTAGAVVNWQLFPSDNARHASGNLYMNTNRIIQHIPAIPLKHGLPWLEECLLFRLGACALSLCLQLRQPHLEIYSSSK